MASLPVRIKPTVTLILVIVTDDTSGGGDDAPPSFRSEGPDEARSLDALFGILADRRSRLVISYLEDVSVNVVDLEHLAEWVAETEERAGVASDLDDHCERVAIALHHNCLPKLDEAAVIDYDPRTKTVKYWGDDRVSDCIEFFEFDEEP